MENIWHGDSIPYTLKDMWRLLKCVLEKKVVFYWVLVRTYWMTLEVKLLENPSWVFHTTDRGEMGNKIIFFNIFILFYYSMLDPLLINPNRYKKHTPDLNFWKTRKLGIDGEVTGMVDGRRKSLAFEREVIVLISLWFSVRKLWTKNLLLLVTIIVLLL